MSVCFVYLTPLLVQTSPGRLRRPPSPGRGGFLRLNFKIKLYRSKTLSFQERVVSERKPGEVCLLDYFLQREYSIHIKAPQGLLKKLELTRYFSSSFMNFIKGLQTEFHKIVWPKPAEAFGLAVIVIIVALIIGYYLGALDALFATILRAIIG